MNVLLNALKVDRKENRAATFGVILRSLMLTSEHTFTCSNSTTETLEKRVKYVQS